MFFKQAQELYFDKCHFQIEGLYKIVNLKASIHPVRGGGYLKF